MAERRTGGELAEGVLGGDRAAISEALNLIDDGRPAKRSEALQFLDRLTVASADRRPSQRVGITGAPGVGKSTLLDALIRQLRERDESVGVVAVDPSSRRTGGALLGDRVRLGSSARDSGVFLRSMAARERLGGLSDATFAGVAILASTFDWVFVETVGVGQSEGEVASLVDTLVFVAQPASGDMMQFMKAGILELPDIFLVNKADLGPAAQRTRSELQAGLGLAEYEPEAWQRPILVSSARDGQGIVELVEQIDAHGRYLAAGERLAERRHRGNEAYLCDSLERRYGSYGIEQVGGVDGVAKRLQNSTYDSVFGLADELGREIEAAFADAAGRKEPRANSKENA